MISRRTRVTCSRNSLSPISTIWKRSLADDLLSISGRLKVRYFNRLDSDLTEVYFRLLPNLWGNLMQVDNVTVNDSPVTPRLESKATALYVPLDETVPSSGHVDIGLNFRVIIPQDGSSNYGTFAYLDGTLALAQFYPIIPLRDELGWRIEIYPSDGGCHCNRIGQLPGEDQRPRGYSPGSQWCSRRLSNRWQSSGDHPGCCACARVLPGGQRQLPGPNPE